MNYCDLAPSYIRAIAPYQPGKPISELERELGITGIVKLASNENPLGASPASVAAMQEAIKTIALYPDGNGFELKDALVKRYGVTHANITLGNGSNDLLEFAARAADPQEAGGRQGFGHAVEFGEAVLGDVKDAHR